jgi:hypothetical protein
MICIMVNRRILRVTAVVLAAVFFITAFTGVDIMYGRVLTEGFGQLLPKCF